METFGGLMLTKINRKELIKKILDAKKCVKVLGAVAFDLPYEDLKDHFAKLIASDNDFTLLIICESDSSLNYDSLISSNRSVSGEDCRYEYGVLKSIADAPIKNLRKNLEETDCRFHIEPESDTRKKLKKDSANFDTEFAKLFKSRYGRPFDELTKEEQHNAIKQKLMIKTYYLSPKIPVIQIDDEFYISYALTKFNHLEFFEKITKEHIWYNEFDKYFKAFLEHPKGASKYATEFTKRANKLEVIEMYNEDRIPLGQLPRDSFLDITRVKVVVWGLIFTRNGKLLIHKRDINAKDNRDMWDKSVGGHVDIEKDIDTPRAAAREIIEELHKREQEGQGGHNTNEMFIPDPSYLIFLGEWRPEFRYEKLYEEIEYNTDQNYYFRMSYDYSKIARNSPRHLEDGSIKLVRVFADLYVCVADSNFENEVNNEELENSDYLLLYPDQIKDLYMEGDCYLSEEDATTFKNKIERHNERMKYDEKLLPLPYTLDGRSLIYQGKFKITPDMDNIINSELWEKEICSFSNTIKNRWERKYHKE